MAEECLSGACMCHACRGVLCMMYHPGHDCRYRDLDQKLAEAMASAAQLAEESLPPCPGCVSEVGHAVPGCSDCGGTGVCRSARRREGAQQGEGAVPTKEVR